ncbi:putative transcriptional regulator, MerR family protein [Microlunatus endophyticus]|uniref:Transcriptional regulator, MerR family protein n=1 Tax=Microlunatus endophyticus TaxID=1716077 RepID=A0A917W156_9ACTN|nr:MerR family transcriptional regulator [Microlunatus endophyticus]GGL56238.1 putative transcriptional regulator, MerR family protein [Microlunatus endophyticus]
MSIQEVARRTGFSEPTLRYYERVGLIPRVPRDPSSRHRRYPMELVERLEALACLRASGLGIDDMRAYLLGVEHGDAERLVALFGEQVVRLDQEMAALQRRRRYVLSKVGLWQARVSDDPAAEAAATRETVQAAEELWGEF